MNYDDDKIDEMVLAPLYLTTFRDGDGQRAWKGYDWEALDRSHQKGYISDPKRKTKSVVMSDDGAKHSRELFESYFAGKRQAGVNGKRRGDAERQ